jgi:predicted amidohydrolase
MKLAAYQMPLLRGGSMEAVELIRRRVKWCEAEGVDILCCPEAALGGLADDAPRPSDIAVNVESGQLRALLAPLASDPVTTIVGFTEAFGGDELYNSAAIFSKGEIVGVYRKRHPAIRSSVYRPGDRSPVFTLGDLRFGIMICNDSNFPELGTSMVARGARVLLVPSNNALRPERADVVALTRATDISQATRNGVAVVRADVAGETDDRISIGSSTIIDRKGMVLQSGKPLSEDLLVADLGGLP